MKHLLLSLLSIAFLCGLHRPASAQCPDGSLPAAFQFTTCCVAQIVNTVNYTIYNEMEEIQSQGTISLNGAPSTLTHELCLPEGCYFTTFSYTAGFGTAQHLQSFEVIGENTSSFNIFQTSQNIPFSFGFCVSLESIACQASFIPTVQDDGVLAVTNNSTPTTGFTSLFAWDYGDNTNTQGFAPAHTYTANGTYEVCLFQALYDGDIPVCVSDTCIAIEMNTVPNNSGCPNEIIIAPGDLCGHYSLSHNGQESGANYWFVDDAIESTSADWSVVFETPGPHQICLAHASATCESSTTICIELEAPDCSNSNCPDIISVEPNGCHGYVFHVNNMGAFGNIVWDFGDGAGAVGQNNVSHVYDSLGVYQVCVQAWNAYCQDGIELCTTIAVAPCGGTGNGDCVGELYLTYESQCGHVHFEGGNNPNNAPVSWNFGDGPSTTTATTVADHYYDTPGVYTVTALISDGTCPNNITLYAVVTIEDCFNTIVCPTSMYAAESNACSTWNFEVGELTPGESVLWNYGDGTIADGGHFSSHEYAASGEYEVCALYSSDYCPEAVELCETILVNCPETCSLNIEQIPTVCGLAILQASSSSPNAEIHWSIGGVETGMIGHVITLELQNGVYPICAWYEGEGCENPVEVCEEVEINNCTTCTELSFGFDSFINEGGPSFLAWNIYNASDMEAIESGMAQYSVNDPYYDHNVCLENGCYLITAMTNSPFDLNAVTPIIGSQADIISIDAINNAGNYGYEILISVNGDCTLDCDMVAFSFTSYPSYGGMDQVEWTLYNSSNSAVASGGYNFVGAEFAQYYSHCLPEDCYTLVFQGNQSFDGNTYFAHTASGNWNLEGTTYGSNGDGYTMELQFNLNSNCQGVDCTLALNAVEIEPGWFEFTAIGNPEVYPMFWDFGDGTTLEATWVALHNYTEPGDYVVCSHIQTDACGVLEACTTIVVEAETPCNFSIWSGPGQTCGDILFEIPGGSALGPIVWQFGNEVVTDNQSIMHHFDEAGVYAVTANASSAECPNVELNIEVIVPECNVCTNVGLVLVSDINSGGTNCIGVVLTNTETNETLTEILSFDENLMTHEWVQCLADGCYTLSFDSCLPILAGAGLSYDLLMNGSSVLNNALITYQDAYSLTLAFGINSTCFDGTCEAYFEYETTELPGQVVLNNLSYTGGGVAAYMWSLGNSFETASDLNQYTYLQNGTYEVCLEIATNLCENTYCQTIAIDNTDCDDTGAIITLNADFQLDNMSDVLNILITQGDEILLEFEQAVAPFNTYSIPVCIPDGCYNLELVSNEPLEALGIFAEIMSNNALVGQVEILSGSFYGGDQFGINDDCTDSVNEHASAAITVYPNPADDLLQWNIPLSVQVKGMALCNHLGQVVRIIPPNERSVDLSELSSGMYYLHITTDRGWTQQKVQVTH